MFSFTTLFIALLFLFPIHNFKTSTFQSLSVAEVLDDLHDAASQADGSRYFNHFASDAVFFGTDPLERWTIPEFKKFAEPYLSTGRGWDYSVRSRHIFYSADGNTAWFDETLFNKYYGERRGAGVLITDEGEWKIAQYNLSIPIPNSLAESILELIQNEPITE